MQDVQIKIDFNDNLLGKVSRDHGVGITVLKCTARKEGGGIGMISIETDPSIHSSQILQWFHNVDPSTSPSCNTVSPGKHIVILTNKKCSYCKAFSDNRCILDSGSSRENGTMMWSVISPDTSSLRQFVQEIRENGARLELVSIGKPAVSELTVQQETVLHEAYRLGFFDVPKRITLDDLAKKNGVSKSTMNLMLRRAQRKIVAKYCLNSRKCK